MDFTLTEEQTAVRDLARKILEDLATNERLKTVEATEPVFDRELWGELARANLLGAALPETHGGSGMGFFTLCVLLEEIGRAVAPISAPESLLAPLPIARFGDDALKQHWLPAVAAGEVVLTAALQEPGNGDLTRPLVEAHSENDGYTLHGEKLLVAAAPIADAILVPARIAGGGAGLFIVERDASGVVIESTATTNRQAHANLCLEGTRIDASARVGNDDAPVLAWLTERATAAVCAVQLGVSDRALSMTADYAKERVQFDRPIGSFQAVHQRAADAYIQLQAIRLTTCHAALLLDAEEPAEDAVAVAKYWAAAGGQFLGYACQHLHGGIGIDVDYPMHRYYPWAKQNELTLGSAPLQLERLGARLADGNLVSAN